MVIPDYRTFKHSNELCHFGIKGKSGRYPLGSGERPYQDYPEKRYKLSNRQINKKIRQLNKAATLKEEAFNDILLSPESRIEILGKKAKAFKDYKDLMNELTEAGVEIEKIEKIKRVGGYVWNGVKFVKR